MLAIGTIVVPAGAQIPWYFEVNLPGLHQHASAHGILVGQIELGTARREHLSLDAGWYRIDVETPPPTISRPAWLPPVDPINAPDNDEWALQISSSVEAAQELVNPLDTFTISFKYGFNAMNGTLFYAMLGNLNLFELAGIAGGAITPDATNTGRYKMFNLTIGRNVLQQIMGDYTELQFSAIGGPDTVWIDDVVYVPPPAAVVVMTGLALFRRRRPGA